MLADFMWINLLFLTDAEDCKLSPNWSLKNVVVTLIGISGNLGKHTCFVEAFCIVKFFVVNKQISFDVVYCFVL